ncbi:MAG: hypothetical protein J7647_18295 [Cyanobacteria bacterium SBLK]|nr:hypothetical protein [Cyanobacteria bacterium SBLK]
MSLLLAIACWGIAPTSTSAETTQGFKAEYFNNKNLTGEPILTRMDETINFDWGSGSPDPSVPADNFSTRWVGKITPKYTETYTFSIMSDDGVRLFVDSEQLIDNWTLHSITNNSKEKQLTAGRQYDVRVEYYEAGGAAIAKLSWSSPSQAEEFIVADSTLKAIVNINSTENLSSSEGAKVTLPAGNYTVSVIGKKDGGEYDAWTKNSRVNGCDEDGKKCKKGWEHKYFYQLGDAKKVKVKQTGRYATPEQALENPPADATFTLTEETEVSFFVQDPKNPANNQGGVSLQIIGK